MSVGHFSRVVEESGIPTVVILIKPFMKMAEEMCLPRTVVTSNLLGRPLGAPGDKERQLGAIRAALTLLEESKAGGSMFELDEPYRVPWIQSVNEND